MAYFRKRIMLCFNAKTLIIRIYYYGKSIIAEQTQFLRNDTKRKTENDEQYETVSNRTEYVMCTRKVRLRYRAN